MNNDVNKPGRTAATIRLAAPLLVIEGALDPPGVAVILRSSETVVEALSGTRGVRVDLIARASQILARCGIEAAELGGVVLGTGPGSFTGLRVALSAAKGLRYACRRDLPLAGVDAPSILAKTAGAALPVRVAIPWGRLRVLLARVTDEGPEAEPSDLMPRSELPQRHELSGTTVIVPPGGQDLPFPDGVRVEVAQCSGIESLALIAGSLIGKELDAGRYGADPLYLVPPDAVLPARASSSEARALVVTLAADDLDAVLAVETASFDAPWTRRMLADELAPGPRRLAIGIRDNDGQLVATALARWDDEILEIVSVAVVPAGRRRGLGRVLVRTLVDRARDEDLRRVDLEVSVANEGAIGLYRSEGFVPVGRRPRYYEDGSDAELMSLLLRRER